MPERKVILNDKWYRNNPIELVRFIAQMVNFGEFSPIICGRSMWYLDLNREWTIRFVQERNDKYTILSYKKGGKKLDIIADYLEEIVND